MYYRARELALNNNQPFHLAAWTRRGASYVFGVNSGKCSTKFARRYRDGQVGYHLHAEMALLKSFEHGELREIYVTRFLKNGEATMSKPCVHCQRFLKEYGVRKVYYTNWKGRWERMAL